MRIEKHQKCHIVQLADRSTWRIWPADLSNTLQWRSTTEVDVIAVEHKVWSHVLVDRASKSPVRVISAELAWPINIVQSVFEELRD